MAYDRLSRRHFFFGSLLAGALPAAGFGSAPSLKFLGYKSPNEKLNIAAIGAGGKGSSDIAGCATENIVALADPDSKRAERTFQKYEKAPKYADFRRMFDKEGKNIDAVIVATPDHMHAAAAMWAMERGKHVFCQKPLTRTIWEARALTAAAAKYKVATQMGNQGYSNEGTRQCAEMIWAGEIGNVTEVHAWTNRPIWPQGLDDLPAEEPVPDTLDWDAWLGISSMRPYSPAYLPFKWRGWFDFGCGALGDMACHILGAPNLALMLGAPSSVECLRQEGKSPYTYPKKSVIRFDFPARGSMPPVKIFWYDGMTGPPPRPEGVPENELLGELPRAARRDSGVAPDPQPEPPPSPDTSGSEGKPLQQRIAVRRRQRFYHHRHLWRGDALAARRKNDRLQVPAPAPHPVPGPLPRLDPRRQGRRALVLGFQHRRAVHGVDPARRVGPSLRRQARMGQREDESHQRPRSQPVHQAQAPQRLAV